MRRAAALLLLAACAHQPPPASRKYTVVMAGHVAGSQTVATNGRQRTIDFEFNARGRGPKIHTVITTDARSITTSLTTSGNDYLKAPVSETFASRAWSNGAERGASNDGNAMYVSMVGPPEEEAVLARALLAAPGHKLALLPAGEASIRKLGELDLHGRRVAAYDIAGLAFSPAAIWLDDQNEFFADASAWQSVVAEG